MFWLLTLPFRIVFGVLLAVLSLVVGVATVVLLPLAVLVVLPVLLLRGGLRLVVCLAALWLAGRLLRRQARHGIVAG